MKDFTKNDCSDAYDILDPFSVKQLSSEIA